MSRVLRFITNRFPRNYTRRHLPLGEHQRARNIRKYVMESKRCKGAICLSKVSRTYRSLRQGQRKSLSFSLFLYNLPIETKRRESGAAIRTFCNSTDVTVSGCSKGKIYIPSFYAFSNSDIPLKIDSYRMQ